MAYLLSVRGTGVAGFAEPDAPLDFGNSGTGCRLVVQVSPRDDPSERFPLRPRPAVGAADRRCRRGAGRGCPVGVLRAAQGADRKLIAAVTVFDVYEGKGIEENKKSLAIAVTLQPREKTLTDQEIEAVAAKIVAEVAKETGGVLRG